MMPLFPLWMQIVGFMVLIYAAAFAGALMGVVIYDWRHRR